MCSLLYPDETEFRNFIVWLEDQKIRHYKIEDRGNLRNIPSSDWPNNFEKVRQIYLHMYMTICIPKEMNTIKFIMSFVVIYKYIVYSTFKMWTVHSVLRKDRRLWTGCWVLLFVLSMETMVWLLFIIINQWLYSTIVLLIADTTFRE